MTFVGRLGSLKIEIYWVVILQIHFTSTVINSSIAKVHKLLQMSSKTQLVLPWNTRTYSLFAFLYQYFSSVHKLNSTLIQLNLINLLFTGSLLLIQNLCFAI